MNVNDAYSVLGLSPASSMEEVKNAYKKLALQYHPDKNSSPDATQRFQEIGAAYNHVIKHLENPSGVSFSDDYGDGLDEMDLDYFLYVSSLNSSKTSNNALCLTSGSCSPGCLVAVVGTPGVRAGRPLSCLPLALLFGSKMS